MKRIAPRRAAVAFDFNRVTRAVVIAISHISRTGFSGRNARIHLAGATRFNGLLAADADRAIAIRIGYFAVKNIRICAVMRVGKMNVVERVDPAGEAVIVNRCAVQDFGAARPVASGVG